jgi:hypothetical protein
VELPVAPGTAFLAGFFMDSALDFVAAKVPWLKKEIPDIEQVVVRTRREGTAVDGTMKVTMESVEKTTREKLDPSDPKVEPVEPATKP